jgi:hypothetical protein
MRSRGWRPDRQAEVEESQNHNLKSKNKSKFEAVTERETGGIGSGEGRDSRASIHPN